MIYTEISTVERFIIKELKKLGWNYIKPKDMLNIRKSLEEPIVEELFKKAIKKINDVELTEADINFILLSLRTIPANIDGVKRFLIDILKNYIVIPLEKEGEERSIKLIDFENPENNDFIVTNQFKLEGLKAVIRPDIVLLVNGIPLVLIECKSPVREEVTWLDAYKDIKGYERDAPELFKYVQFSIATDGTKTYYFPNAYNEEGKDHLGQWKDPYPHKIEEFEETLYKDLKITLYGLLTKENLLDIIQNYIFIRKEKQGLTKIMARYMQYRASNKIYKRVINTLKGRENKKFGLIWHWQGSGKTYTMAFTAWKLLQCPEAERPSIYVMVDRIELEEQIEKDFAFIQIPIEKIKSIKKLIEYLQWGEEGKRGIFLVTIEKFRPKEFLKLKEEIEIERENVVVLADEVHRTHYGKFSTMMRSILKNAFIFGFTGTPLSKRERNTFQKFCPPGELYLDRYTMLDALNDGFTVPLSYQARLPQYHLKKEQLKQFIEFEKELEEELTTEEKRELKRKIDTIKEIIKKPDRIREIAKDISEHFKEVVEPTGLNAMIVTVDRTACVLYKKAIDEFLPQEYSEIIMTMNRKDEEIIRNYLFEIQEKYKTKNLKDIHKKVIDKFKMGKLPKILIVTNMLITGFDSPNLWTMYLDKPLKEHRILQAIARTNRPYANKKFGLIIDYIGILKELETAFEKFEASDAKALRAVIRDLSEEEREFDKLMKDALEIFKDLRHEDLDEVIDALIDPEKAKKFEETMKKLMKSYEMISGEPFLRKYLSDYNWLVKIYVTYNKRFKKKNIDELKIERLSRKTKQLIQKTIDITEIEDRYPTVSIDKNYIEALRKTKPKTIGAAIDILTNVQVEIRKHPLSPFFLNLSKEIEMIYEQLRTRRIETEDAIQKLLQLSQKIVKWKEEEQEIGREKYLIYETIKATIPQIKKKEALSFIDTLLQKLKNEGLLFDGWQHQRDIRRKVKREMRILLLSKLKQWKDEIDELMEKIFEVLVETT